MATIITYTKDGTRELEIPSGEAFRCVLYRNPGKLRGYEQGICSEVSDEDYCFCALLNVTPTPEAHIICNGETLATSQKGLRWEITPSGQSRLLWEGSLIKQRWRAGI